MDIVCPEEYPGKGHQHKGDEYIKHIIEPVYFADASLFTQFFSAAFCQHGKDAVKAMQHTPDDKRPVGPMPEAAHQENKEQVEIHAGYRHPITTQ